MASGKKGQVTLFVILGILVILIASLSIYIFTIGEEGEVEQEEKEEKVTPKSELNSFVDSCIRQVADEGMEIMRMQGGYINIPDGIKTLEVNDDQKIIDTNEGKKIAKTPGSNEVPYYIEEEGFSVPGLSFLESQLESYISKRLEYCVNGFESFEEKGFEVEEGEINTSVNFGEATVIDVYYPVKLTKGDKVMEQENFNYDIPINFYKMYDNALRLATHEYLDAYLEHHMKRLISLYSYGGGSKGEYDLPPFGLTIAGFNCENVQWQKDSVKRKLEGLFSDYMPMQKFARTNFTRIMANDSSLQGTYDSFVEDILPKDMDLHVNQSYKSEWGMEEFDIKPSSGDSLEPDETSFEGMMMIPMICSVDYSFKYTIEMPILFRMWSDDNNEYQLTAGESDNDFIYRFFMETKLCGNQPRQCTGKPSYLQNMSEEMRELLNGTSICDNRNSGDLTFKVKDYENGTPLSNVIINYYCGTEKDNCYVGKTGEEGRVTAQLPYCDNGVLSFTKDRYYDKQELLDVKSSLDRVYEKKMLKKKELNVSVKLIKAKELAKAYTFTDGFTRATCDGTSPDEVFESLLHEANHTNEKGERVDIISANVKSFKNFIGPSFTYPSLHSGNPRIPGKGVSFPPGEYDVSMSYVSQVDIEPSQIQAGDETVDMSLDPSGSGTYEGSWSMGSMEFPWIVSKSDIVDNEKVVFYMLADFLPTDDLDASMIQEKPTDSEGLISVEIDVPSNSLPSRNCQNSQMTKDIRLAKGEYMDKLKPEFKNETP